MALHPINPTAIRERRDERDLSNEEFAGALGISPLYLRNILSKTDKPGDRLVHRMARVLGVTIDDITATNDGVPDEPPKQPKREPAHPTRRQDQEKSTGPKRATGKEVAA
ncbi:helix-turn-helix domain-containing protein [Amycolatopsis jejuensis]|uniref:helix-turn-helix domain-containing protein n=1 Tax=Amycolatopsis jejuensis TaxID=330084 RepID=UPI00052578E4|nr:helix-turn-helix transcriptional regulator [Amycolatopsis jejuensis]